MRKETRFRFWLWLIALVGVIVPRRLRADWRAEWKAELRWQEEMLSAWERLDFRSRLTLIRHSLGSFWDAVCLQPRRLEEEMFQDLRFGARMLIGKPGFTFVALFTLALGIGANTAIFSVVNGVLLRPLPYPEPERIVRLWESHPPTNLPAFSVAFPNFLDWRAQNRVFTRMAAYREDGFNLLAGSEARRVSGARVTQDFFSVLGVLPARGRAFLPPEDAPGGERAVIISHALWQQNFGLDPQIIGRQLSVDGESRTVVGVMPAGFRFPLEDVELWIPYALDPAATDRNPHFLRVIGRLKPGATIDQARAEMETIAVALEQAYPESNKGWRVFMLPLHEAISAEVETPLWVLLGAVLFVLLIACANVASLLLSRGAARERELAIRAALGAGRFRLVRQLLLESLLLALLGGAGALLVGALSVRALVALGPRDIPRLDEVGLDAVVLGFTLLLSLLTGVIFGLAPALQRSKLDLNTALKDGGRTSGGSSRRMRHLLLIFEVAFAMLLLVGAGLMLKSLMRLQQVAPGFAPERGLTMEINFAPAKYGRGSERAAFLKEAIERMRAIPGVESAAATHRLPLRGNSGLGFAIEGRPAPATRQSLTANYRAISPDYFRAMGTPLVAGRAFSEEEAWQKAGVVIINQALERRHWPNASALGERIKLGGPDAPWFTIVGIAADVKESGLDSETQGGMYLPYIRVPVPRMTLVVRTSVEPLSLARAIRTEIERADREQAVSNISTLAELLDEAVAQPRFNTLLLALFALLSLVLSMVGVYGVIAYSVAQRTREIGVRLALGAGRGNILRLMVGQGMKPVAIGLGLGVMASLGLTRLLESLLYGTSARDPLIYISIAALLALSALAACYLPARRAMRVDPVTALRHD